MQVHLPLPSPSPSQADDDVVVQVFDSHGYKTPAELRGLTGEVRGVPHTVSVSVTISKVCLSSQSAVRKFDYSVCEMINRRNALQHMKQSREKMLSSLEAQVSVQHHHTHIRVQPSVLSLY